MTASRRLAAVLATDVAGIRGKALRCELLDPKISEHHRLIVKTTGDGMLVEFASVVGALGGRGAAMSGRNTGVAVASAARDDGSGRKHC